MSKTSRYTYIDALRAVCSAMVIAIHVIMYYINAFPVRSVSWSGLMFSKALTQCAVPIFFMISGATILSSTKDEPYGTFIKRRLLRVAIPFFAYSVLYYLFFVFIKQEFSLGVYEFFRLFARAGISGHLWYIYALIPLYFLFPVLRKLVQNVTQKQLLTFIAVIFVISSLLPCLNEVFSLFSNFKIGYYSYGKAGVYLNYTLIGYYIHKFVIPNAKSIKTRLWALTAAALSLGGMTALTFFLSGEKIDQTWIDITWPFVIIYSAAVMILFKLHYETKTISDKKANFISSLGMLSFSAYLVHMLYLRTVQIYLPRSVLQTFTNPEAAAILLAVFVLGVLVCYLWAFIVSKIPVIKKIL